MLGISSDCQSAVGTATPYAFNIDMLQIFRANDSDFGGNGWLTQGKLTKKEVLAQANFPTFYSVSKPQMFALKFRTDGLPWCSI